MKWRPGRAINLAETGAEKTSVEMRSACLGSVPRSMLGQVFPQHVTDQ